MEVYVLDENFETVLALDIYQSLIWTDRYCDYGDFEIYTIVDMELINALSLDRYLWTEDSDHQMIIEDVRIETDVENGNFLIVSGRSLESILERRIVWSQTNLKGNLQLEVKRLLNENVISPSIADRKITNFIFEDSDDPKITNLTIDAQYTGDNLYDVVKDICQEKNLGFKITLNDENQFVFKLYSGIDRSYEQDERPYVVFSPDFDNFINSDYLESSKSLKTVTLVAGEGEGAERKTVVVGDNPKSGLSRRELFTDARDISSNTGETTLTDDEYNAKLKQRGEEKLKETRETKTTSAQVKADQQYLYGKDFFIGDMVQLRNEYGMEKKVRVVEFIHSNNLNGYEAYPTFEIVEEDD